jgi:uncharacterized membrane-anchored protein
MASPSFDLTAFFSSIKGAVTVSPMVVLILAAIGVVIGVVMVLLFEYHWKAYGVDKIEMLRVRFWYYAGIIVFGGGMVVSALLYTILSSSTAV